jgi:hypothetical protein
LTTKTVGNPTVAVAGEAASQSQAAASLPLTPASAVVQKLDLPKDCEYVSIDGKTASVVICRQPEDGFWDKLIKDSPSLIVSVVAIVVSIAAFVVSKRQQKYVITRSIKDDYWLRTLVSPVCISPIIDLRNEIVKSIPSTSVSGVELRNFAVEVAGKFAELNSALANLSIVSQDLVKKTKDKLSLAEDEVATYIALLGHHIDDPAVVPAPDFASCRDSISGKILEVLRPIQDHQLRDLNQD